jgi:hypothetical protein
MSVIHNFYCSDCKVTGGWFDERQNVEVIDSFRFILKHSLMGCSVSVAREDFDPHWYPVDKSPDILEYFPSSGDWDQDVFGNQCDITDSARSVKRDRVHGRDR